MLSFRVLLRRWLPWVVVSLVGCSGGDEPVVDGDDGGEDTAIVEDAQADADAPVEAEADAQPDADAVAEADADATADAEADAPADADADALVDTGTDTEVLDSGSDSMPVDSGFDSGADTAIDTAFTLPTWSPVCVPPPDSGTADASDAALDADDADVGDGSLEASDDADATLGADSDATVVDDADATLADSDDAASDSATGDAASDATTCTATRVRIVASNLTSGSSQSYELPGIHILQGLHPDIALMQEFKATGGLRALVDTAFDPSFRYVTELSVGSIPNGIVSRYPILESGEWDDPDLTDRDWVWARIDVPGPIDLFAVSTHLRTTSVTARDAEAKNLVTYIKGKVPSGVYLVIGGDFNTTIQTELALLDLAEVVSVSAPYATDQAGNANTNQPRSKPYDWVLPNDLLRARMIPVSIGAASFPAGLVFDTRVFTPLTDVAPAVSTDSAATNMQHMAVVRDFALGD